MDIKLTVEWSECFDVRRERKQWCKYAYCTWCSVNNVQWSSFCAHSCWLRNSHTPLWPSIVPCIPVPASTISVAGSLDKTDLRHLTWYVLGSVKTISSHRVKRGTDLMLPEKSDRSHLYTRVLIKLIHLFITGVLKIYCTKFIHKNYPVPMYIYFLLSLHPFSSLLLFSILPPFFSLLPPPFLSSPSLPLSPLSIPLSPFPPFPPFSFSSLSLLPPHLSPLPPFSASPFSSFSPGLPPPCTPSFIVLICGTHINVITLTIH